MSPIIFTKNNCSIKTNMKSSVSQSIHTKPQSKQNMKTCFSLLSLLCITAVSLLWGTLNSAAQTYGSVTPYSNDANTVMLDHFDGSTSASILAYTNNGGLCGPEKPSILPNYSYLLGTGGLGQALALYPPAGDSTRSYSKYPGELLTQANGTLECWINLTNSFFVLHQLTYVGECNGDVGGISVGPTGQITIDIWPTPSTTFSFNSGTNLVPLNIWTHLALTWGSGGAKLYMNGILVGSNPNTGSFTHWSDSNSLFEFIDGYLDELRVSNVQRTNFNLPCMTCPPAVDLKMFAGLIINGPIGSNYNVQATSTLGTPNWITLTNITLPTQPYTYIDYRTPTNSEQFYRIVP
jgi:hypothetical protein